MNKPNPVEEPSMEEILASIRRIISDGEEAPVARSEPDEDVHAAAGPMPDEAPAPEPDDEPPHIDEGAVEEEILDLTEEMSMDDGANPALAETMADEAETDESTKVPEVEPTEPEVVFGQDAQAAPSESVSEDDAPPVGNGAAAGADFKSADQLLSPTADAHVTAAFGRLAHTILSQDARTLEDLVQEMLRPMLKEWLDDNLPQLVERLVRAEIERVSRGKS